MSKNRRAGIAILLLVAAGAVSGQTADPVPRGPSREPMPYRFEDKVLRDVPKAFLEDAPACILYTATTHLIERDGTVETITHEVTRLNGRKGIENLGEYRSIYYDPSFQKLTLNQARVLKPGGKVVTIEPGHLQLRDVSTDYQSYDKQKQLVISFPNLEVGDIYDVKWTTRGKNPEFDGQFFNRYTFGDDQYPVVRDELRVRLPKDKTLHHAVLNGKVELVTPDEGGQRLYHWYVSNRPELPRDDDGPSREELRLQVVVSTFSSWAQVGRWKEKLRADCWKCTPEIRKVVEQATRDSKTPVDKARALTTWVKRHIRYVSLGPEGRGYTPHPPHQVLANLYGDCKDQTQLLAVMMREAGLDVALVTLGILDDGQVVADVPSPWGTHALLLVRIDGKEYWVDTTVAQAAWDFLPRSDRDRVVYVTRGADLQILRTPRLTSAQNRTEQTTHLAVQADGASVARRTMTYHGLAATSRRDAWNEAPPGERRRLMTSELQDANSRSRLLSLFVDDAKLKDFEQPVTARMEYQINRHFSGDLAKEGSLTDSLVWNRLLAYTLDPERRSPLQLWTPFESIHHYIVELPLALRFDDVPRKQHAVSRWGSFRLDVRHESDQPRRLELTFHTRLEDVRVEPADFPAFQKFHEEVNRHWRVWLNLKPTQDLADAPGLEALLALAPGGDTTAPLVLAKLYQRHEKLADARRVLRWARFFHPQEAPLWELAVKIAQSTEEEEQLYADMVERFNQEPKYAVALGAARVNRGDHPGARKVLEPLAAHTSHSVRGNALYHLARSAFRQKQAEAALKYLEAARLADADTVNGVAALQFKAQLQQQLGQTREAIDTYRQALKIEPDSRDILAVVIGLELAEDRRAEALEHLRRYTLAVGSDVLGVVQAAEFHLRMDRLEDAAELAGRARELGFHVRTQRILGLIHLRRSEWDKAAFHLDRADTDAEVLEGLIRSHLALGKLHEAERYADKAKDLIGQAVQPALKHSCEVVAALVRQRTNLLKETKVPPAKAVASAHAIGAYVCADWAHRLGQPAGQVETLLALACTKDAEVGPALALRALLLLNKGQLTRALADAERAVTLRPAEARAYFVRGRIAQERADLQAAQADLTRAVDLSKRREATYLHWLAAVHSQLGRRTEALALQREAVKLRPDDAELARQLRDLENGS